MKGHKDRENVSPEHYTVYEKMNIVADHIAKSYAYEVELNPSLQEGIQYDPFQWTVNIQVHLVKKDFT